MTTLLAHAFVLFRHWHVQAGGGGVWWLVCVGARSEEGEEGCVGAGRVEGEGKGVEEGVGVGVGVGEGEGVG